jgi:hypothetical protein
VVERLEANIRNNNDDGDEVVFAKALGWQMKL